MKRDYFAEADIWPPGVIGWNENNACILERILNSRQRLDHRSEIILKSADRLDGRSDRRLRLPLGIVA
jgi:hypothetical protein